MSIPDYQSLMLPLLRFASARQDYTLRSAIDALAIEFQLTDEERRELLPSGRQPVIHNRVGWASTYLKKAGLLTSLKWSVYRITDLGLEVLKAKPGRIDVAFLKQYPSFREFQTIKHEKDSVVAGQTDEEIENPEEALETAYETLRKELASELLEQLKGNDPSFFERTVVALLVKMGYGGSLRDAGQAIGKSGDEGIDGIIKEDRLGLDIIYIQAKRWEGNVGRAEIQKFAGALQGQRERKGVFITTSGFSRDAHDYASRIDSKIVLIDGDQLAEFMIENNVGVTPIAIYEIKQIDSDFFAGE